MDGHLAPGVNLLALPEVMYLRIYSDLWIDAAKFPQIIEPSDEGCAAVKILRTQIQVVTGDGTISMVVPTVSWTAKDGGVLVRGVALTDEHDNVVAYWPRPQPITLNDGDTLTADLGGPPLEKTPSKKHPPLKTLPPKPLEAFTFPLIKKSFPKKQLDDIFGGQLLLDQLYGVKTPHPHAASKPWVPPHVEKAKKKPKSSGNYSSALKDAVAHAMGGPTSKSPKDWPEGKLGSAFPCPRCSVMRLGTSAEVGATKDELVFGLTCSKCKRVAVRLLDNGVKGGALILSEMPNVAANTQPAWCDETLVDLPEAVGADIDPTLVRIAQIVGSYPVTDVKLGQLARLQLPVGVMVGEISAMRVTPKVRVLWILVTKCVEADASIDVLAPTITGLAPPAPFADQAPYPHPILSVPKPKPSLKLALKLLISNDHGSVTQYLLTFDLPAVVKFLKHFGIPDAEQQITDLVEVGVTTDLYVLNSDDQKLSIAQLLNGYVTDCLISKFDPEKALATFGIKAAKTWVPM